MTVDMNINFKELEEDQKKNREERLNFVRLWAEYVRTHDDKEWSMQQNVLLNSMIQKHK